MVGATFTLDDGTGSSYRVTLVKVIDPARGTNQVDTPDSGKRFVGLVFRIKALSGNLQGEDANNDAVLVGANGQRLPGGPESASPGTATSTTARSRWPRAIR